MQPALTIPAPSSSSLRANDFLTSLQLSHGPIDLFGRYVNAAVSDARRLGLDLSFGTFEELLALNQANRENWPSLIGVFDPRNGPLPRDSAFCIFGRNGRGEVVATHAARLFAWQETHFAAEAESLRLFYADPAEAVARGEWCAVSAVNAHEISGAVVYSGAAWYRPDYRGLKLGRFFPQLGKVLAAASWQVDHIVSFMQSHVHAAGLAPKFGYTRAEKAVKSHIPGVGDFDELFLSMSTDDVIDAAVNYLDRRSMEIDAGVGRGATQDRNVVSVRI
jgi:hypothetical protein